MATFSMIAVASMVGIIPTIGFVAKEGVLTALLHEAAGGSAWGIVALRRDHPRVRAHGGVRHPLRLGCLLDEDGTLQATSCPAPSGPTRRSDSSAPRCCCRRSPSSPGSPRHCSTSPSRRTPTLAPASTAGVAAPEHPAHLALWHGLEPALWISLGTIVVGAGLFWLTRATGWTRRLLPVHRGRRLQRAPCAASRACRWSPRASPSADRCPCTSARSSSSSSPPRAPRCSPAPSGRRSWTRTRRRCSSSSRRS